MFKNEPGMYIV